MSDHCNIRITAADHARIMEHLYPGDDDEHGAVLLAGIVDVAGALTLVVRDVVPAQFGTDYVEGTVGYRALSPSFIHHQIVRCREERLAYLAIHNHDADDYVGFSRIDMASHERGYPALVDIGRGVPVGALVYGRRSVEADIWLPDGRRLSLGQYCIVGSTIERQFSSPRRVTGEAPEFDRQIRLFGTMGQAILAQSKVAVVGLGGIGSLVAEYCARLGIGELLLVDDDLIENTNLARVVGATFDDVANKRPKVAIAARHSREARKAVGILEVAGDVAHKAVAMRLRDCDFIFLAADSMRARLVVNAIAHQYLIPVVQLGAKVTADGSGALTDVVSVVRHVRPGHACLWCNGWIDATQLAIELKTDDERKAQAYGVEEPNPSVITLNAVAAAHGVNDFLMDYLGLRSGQRDYAYEHFHALTGTVRKVEPRQDEHCRECGTRFGRGDAMDLPVTGF